MPKILVLYYSSYGHTEKLAHAVAKGAAKVINENNVTTKRVPELVPEKIVKEASYKVNEAVAIASPNELIEYDAIIFGTPTRFGNMASQMKNFLDQTGSLWAKGALIGKIGSVFVSTGSQHGGQETTITSFHHVLMHHGFILAGLPYSFQGQQTLDEISGGSPYGATTIAGNNSREPSENELNGAFFQGRHVAEITSYLVKGKSD